MKKILLLITAAISFTLKVQAQTMPPCGTNDAPGNTCLQATPICNLDGYCGTTDASYTVNAWGNAFNCLFFGNCGLSDEFCGSIENNSFLSFVADATNISFDVWVYNTNTPGDGIQIMIFQPAGNCSGNVTTYYCNGNMPPSPNAQTVSASGLTIGQTYYIMIDGFAGAVCDYTFAANAGIATPVAIDLGNSVTICQGESVTATASGGNGSYNWNASPDLNTTTGAVVTITPPTTIGAYTYTVNSTGGTTLCPSSTSTSLIVNVEGCGCLVDATVDANQFCEGSAGSINLSATSLNGGAYSWTQASSPVGSTQNVSSVSVPSNPGTYYYVVNASDNLGQVCTDSVSVTINPLPNINAGSSQIITCTNPAVTLNGSSATSGAVPSWTGSGIVSGGGTFTPIVNQSGAYQLTVTVPVTNCSTSATVNVTVDTLSPIVSITGNLLITPCQSSTTILTANSSISGVGYIWSGPSIVSGATQQQATVSQQGTYSVTVTNPTNGCSGSASVNVAEYTPFNPTIFSDTIVCATSFQILANSVVSDGGGYWQEANNNGGFSPNNGVQNPLFVPNPSISSYTLIYTDSICGNTATAQVIFPPRPIVQTPPAYSCGDMQEVLYVTTYGGGQWTANDNPATTWHEDTALVFLTNQVIAPGGNQVPTIVETFPTAGTYSLTFTDNICGYTETISVNMLPYPWTAIYDTTLCVGVNYQLNAWQSPYSLNYVWNTGANGLSIIVSSPGVYTIEASNECYTYIDSALIDYKVCDISAPNVVSLSSQSGNSAWFVDSYGVTDFNCIIVNRWGELIYEFSDPNGNWNGRDLRGNVVNEGVYFYTIKAKYEGGEEVEKQGFIHVVH